MNLNELTTTIDTDVMRASFHFADVRGTIQDITWGLTSAHIANYATPRSS